MGQEEYPSERRRESVLLVVSGRRLRISFPLQKRLVDLRTLWDVFKGLRNASVRPWSGLERLLRTAPECRVDGELLYAMLVLRGRLLSGRQCGREPSYSSTRCPQPVITKVRYLAQKNSGVIAPRILTLTG